MTSEDLVGQENYFEVYSGFDGQPMKKSQRGKNVTSLSSSCRNSSCNILDRLKASQRMGSPIVSSRSSKCADHLFGSLCDNYGSITWEMRVWQMSSRSTGPVLATVLCYICLNSSMSLK